MLYVLKSLFYRPPIRMGRVDNTLIRTTRLRNAQFVSFMSQSDVFSACSTDRYDAKLRRRKFMKAGLLLATVGAVAWVILESARAISMF